MERRSYTSQTAYQAPYAWVLISQRRLQTASCYGTANAILSVARGRAGASWSVIKLKENTGDLAVIANERLFVVNDCIGKPARERVKSTEILQTEGCYDSMTTAVSTSIYN